MNILYFTSLAYNKMYLSLFFLLTLSPFLPQTFTLLLLPQCLSLSLSTSLGCLSIIFSRADNLELRGGDCRQILLLPIAQILFQANRRKNEETQLKFKFLAHKKRRKGKRLFFMNLTFLLERMSKKSSVERIMVLQILPLNTQGHIFFS